MRTFWVLLLLVLVTAGYADVFRLKSGEVIEGELISENDKNIVVKIKYGIIRIDKSEIIPEEVKMPEKKTKPAQTLGEPIVVSKPISGLEPRPLTGFTSSEYLQGMHRWLDSQTDHKTGLLESYRPTADVYLEKQGATYDQALAGLSFLVLDDIKKAKAILDFYKKKWNGKGFSNFYYTPTGNPGLEGIAHLGPNLWIAILALHYDRIAGRQQYVSLAEDIVRWAMSLPHYHGGAAMSDRDEWRAPWTKVVSTENNIDYYAVLNILEGRTKDAELKMKIQQEKFGVISFLTNIVYNRKNGSIYRGFHEGVVDRESALDTVSWLVAAVGLKELREWKIDIDRFKGEMSDIKRAREWRIDIKKIIKFAERKFLVLDNDIKGFDFTDKTGAFKAKRDRMISIEWTLAMINMYCIYRNYYNELAGGQERLGNMKKAGILYKKADEFEHKAVFYLKQMDKTMLRLGPQRNLYAYPYATRSYWLVFYDSPWWKTPKAGANGAPAGSVASTAWRIFATRFNPLKGNGDLE